ncbi:MULTISPECIES: hypothetical protein [Rhodococcus]|nr:MULTISPECIES: hypothetical protein [Rhodococcus]SCC70231.1 hypothetical protein GA0061093_13519 [Rhodococcus qingshengii]
MKYHRRVGITPLPSSASRGIPLSRTRSTRRVALCRRVGIVVLATLATAVATSMSRASAAPVDTVLPIPVAGLATGPTGLGGPLVGQHVTATTDTERPGITEFRGTEGICACMVHWRNLTTGVAGTSNNFWFGLPATGATAITGSGVLVATVTTSGAGSPITVLPGAGLWIVP